MFGNRSRQDRPRKTSDPLASAGVYIVILGAVMFVLPTYFHESWLLTSLLGSMQAPLGLALIVVGIVLAGSGFVRGQVTKPTETAAPTLDPSIPAPPPGPEEARLGAQIAPLAPTAPSPSFPAAPVAAVSTPYPTTAPTAPLGAGIDAPPPPLEPIYRPPTSLDDLGPSGPA